MVTRSSPRDRTAATPRYKAPRGTIIVSPKTGWVEDGAYAAARRVRHVVHAADAAPMGDRRRDAPRVPEHRHHRTGGRVPARCGHPRDANLDAILAPAYAWNATCPPGQQVTVDVRFQVGERAPTTGKPSAAPCSSSDGSFGKNAAVPRWHVPAYLPLFENAWAVIGPMMDARAIIGSVNNPMAAPFYPEVFLLFGNSVVEDRPAPEPDITNEMNLVAAGWTPALQRGFMRAAVNIPAKYTSRVVVYLAINPTIFPTESSWDQGVHVGDRGRAHRIPPSVARWGGELLGPDELRMTGTGNYQTMYAGICARPAGARSNSPEPTAWPTRRTATPTPAGPKSPCGGPTSAGTPSKPWPTVTGGAANGWPTSFQNRVTDMTASDTVLTAKANVRRDRA